MKTPQVSRLTLTLLFSAQRAKDEIGTSIEEPSDFRISGADLKNHELLAVLHDLGMSKAEGEKFLEILWSQPPDYRRSFNVDVVSAKKVKEWLK